MREIDSEVIFEIGSYKRNSQKIKEKPFCTNT